LSRNGSAIADPSATASAADGVLRLDRPSGRRLLALLIVPLPRRTTEIWAPALPTGQAIVFVTDPERETELFPDILRGLYGLTPKEALLAVEISRGDGLQMAADRLGIANATAHTHLLRVLAKTDTRRQSELIDHVKARLGSYKAPKTIRFVDELPLSAVGKVVRRHVKEGYWAAQDRRI
jgi:DNA-binding CsgD family transcriptional regulator